MSEQPDAPPGIRPLLFALWPDSDNVYAAAAAQFDVHLTTVYDWCSQGMGKARGQYVLALQELCQERLGYTPTAATLLAPSN